MSKRLINEYIADKIGIIALKFRTKVRKRRIKVNKILRNTVKNRVVFPVILATATICLCTLCCSFVSQRSCRTIEEMLSGDSVAVSQLSSPLWTVRESKGKIGIFDSEGILTETLDVTLSALPSQDREYLIQGIPVYSLQELLSLIEDYTG